MTGFRKREGIHERELFLEGTSDDPDLQALAAGPGVLPERFERRGIFRDPSDDSIRAREEGLIPIRSATSACENPADFRADKRASRATNSSSSASYAVRKAGSFIHSSLVFSMSKATGSYRSSSLTIIFRPMLHLFQTSACNDQVSIRGLFRFFDEPMKHDHPFSGEQAKECPSDSFLPPGPDFEQPFPHGLHLGQPKVRAVLSPPFDDPDKTDPHTFRPGPNSPANGLVVISDRIFHTKNINTYVNHAQESGRPFDPCLIFPERIGGSP